MARVKIERVRHTVRAGVIGLFAVSGVAHLVRPRVFYSLMPPRLPSRDLVIYASGAAELICSVGVNSSAVGPEGVSGIVGGGVAWQP